MYALSGQAHAGKRHQLSLQSSYNGTESHVPTQCATLCFHPLSPCIVLEHRSVLQQYTPVKETARAAWQEFFLPLALYSPAVANSPENIILVRPVKILAG